MNLHWIIKFLLWITWLEHNFCIGESAITLKQRISVHTTDLKLYLRSYASMHRMTHFLRSPYDATSTIPALIQFAVKMHFYGSEKFARNRRHSRDSHKTFFTQTNRLYDDARVRLNIFFSFASLSRLSKKPGRHPAPAE